MGLCISVALARENTHVAFHAIIRSGAAEIKVGNGSFWFSKKSRVFLSFCARLCSVPV